MLTKDKLKFPLALATLCLLVYTVSYLSLGYANQQKANSAAEIDTLMKQLSTECPGTSSITLTANSDGSHSRSVTCAAK